MSDEHPSFEAPTLRETGASVRGSGSARSHLATIRVLGIRLPTWLTAAGGLAVAAGLAWWAIVFGRVVANDYMTVLQAAPCALDTSDLCSLAQALCASDHILGIKRYSAGLLWTGVSLLAAGLALPALKRA